MAMAGLGDNTAKRIEPELGEEPSMDEILASIRQIIADDEKPKAAAEDDRTLYTHPTDVSNNNAGTDFAFAEALQQAMGPNETAPIEATPVETAPLPMPPGSAMPLEAQLAAGMSAALAAQAAVPEPAPSLPVPAIDTGDVTEQVVQRWLDDNTDAVEATVKDVAQPVIRAWMAENLPGMVERLIREEIEFVSRGKPRS